MQSAYDAATENANVLINVWIYNDILIILTMHSANKIFSYYLLQLGYI